MTRIEQIREIAKQNALEGLDQGRIEDYRENMMETIGGMFPDCTSREALEAETTFQAIIDGAA